MIKICAWCNKVIEGSDDKIVTHGICKNCVEYFTLNPISLQQLIDEIEMPVFVVDKEGRMQGANSLAMKSVNKDLSQIKNKLGGDVIECIHAKTPEGCGKTIHCTGCAIRMSVTKTIETGEQLKNISAYQQIQSENKKIKTMRFLISTEKMGEKILLQIEDVEEQE